MVRNLRGEKIRLTDLDNLIRMLQEGAPAAASAAPGVRAPRISCPADSLERIREPSQCSGDGPDLERQLEKCDGASVQRYDTPPFEEVRMVPKRRVAHVICEQPLRPGQHLKREAERARGEGRDCWRWEGAAPPVDLAVYWRAARLGPAGAVYTSNGTPKRNNTASGAINPRNKGCTGQGARAG